MSVRLSWLRNRGHRLASSSSSLRRASVGAGALLLVAVTIASITLGSERLHREILASVTASTATDLFQDARFYATTEEAALNAYRRDPTAGTRTKHDEALRALAATLASIGQTDHTAADVGPVTRLTTMHTAYQDLSRQEFTLLDLGHSSQADRLHTTQIIPLVGRLTDDLGTLEERHHQIATAGLRAAHSDAVLLQVGPPILLGLALFMLASFALVSRKYRRTVERQALNDALTGLPNRRLFADRVAYTLSGSRRRPVEPVVMLLDLDRFKEVNDTLGHHQGDQLLIQLATRLTGLVRPLDTVARLGGDEFAVLLPDGGAAAGTEVAKRILASLENPFSLAGITVGVETSIGIAVARESIGSGADTIDAIVGGDDTPDLLQQADTAMYAAKRERCGYVVYSPSGEPSTPTHLTLLGELRTAFDRDELFVHFQPKVAVDTGELLGVEALARWQHPTRGLLSPAEFIPLAEGTTLIHRLTTIILEKALHLSREWLDKGTLLPVSVNVSARTLLDHAFPATVARHLAAAGVAPAALCLELTESTIMSDPERALTILRELHAMGVRLSVDDFGIGYSSMAYLKILPVDELKVDRSFVHNMTTDAADKVLVQSAVDLGHNLGLAVVAEGVEDDATLVALKKAGADIVQGYHLGRPMTAAHLELWIETRPDRPIEVLTP